jgi:membrane-associated HD superfamily phosphohydrolase
MALFDFFRSAGNSLLGSRRRRKSEPGSAILRFLENSRFVASAVFVLTVAAIFTISFVGVSPAAFRILPDQQATVRLKADQPFSYKSEILTARKRERLLEEVPRVFRIDKGPIDEFEKQIRQVLGELDHLDPTWATLSQADRFSALARIADAINSKGGFQISVRDLDTLMNFNDAAARDRLVENGLFVLREIHNGGIYSPEGLQAPAGDRELMMFHVIRDTGQVAQLHVLSVDVALTTLKINLGAENVPQAVSTALLRLLRPGVRANLVFDREQSEALERQVLETMKPEIVNVQAGDSIIEPQTKVTREQAEMLRAYQDFLNRADRLPTGIDEQTIGRILLVLGMIIVAGFFVRLEDPMTLESNSRLGLLALVLVFSLSLLRLTIEVGNSPYLTNSPEVAALLPYIAPTAFAPMVIAVLIGAGPALFSGLLVSVFAAIIFGNRVDVLVLSLLTTSVAAFACRSVRRRARRLRAGWLSRGAGGG